MEWEFLKKSLQVKDLQCGNVSEKVTESLQKKYRHNDIYVYLDDGSSE